MNEHLKNRLHEGVSSNNIAYILSDNKEFSMTGYKVMQNQSNDGLLQCAKIMYNGKIKLVYLVGDYKPLSYVVSRVGLNELNSVIFNLIQRAIDIKSNGFFKAENLELDFNRIFVDISDYSVHFIYFPLAEGLTGKISAFENEFRVALISLFNSFPVFKTPVFQRLCSDLANGAMSLEMIIKKVQENFQVSKYSQQNNNEYHKYQKNTVQNNLNTGINGSVSNNNYGHNTNSQKGAFGYSDRKSNFSQETFVQHNNPNEHMYHNWNKNISNQNDFYGNRQQFEHNSAAFSGVAQPVMTISSVNSPVPVTLTINVQEYLIGKNAEMVNGAITFNPAISRVHCKVLFKGGKYYLIDLGSANGTFLNQQRLAAQQMMEIHSGDYLQLANSDFIISF